MTLKEKIFNRIKWTIFFFLFVFSPPIIPGIHTYFVMALLTTAIIIVKHGKKYNSILHNSEMYKWILQMIFFGIYVYTVYSINLIILQEEVQASHYITLIKVVKI